MLTSEDFGRLLDLVERGKSLVGDSPPLALDQESARRQLTEILDEGIQICEASHERDVSENGGPLGR